MAENVLFEMMVCIISVFYLCDLNLFVSHLAFNQICRIENISHLDELQVLNLSGNCISRLENLQGLDSLTELNLRHNCICAVVRNLYPLEN